ncbi:hypothetical protein PFISCL1PPCAC_11052 [Pristionchus fissidentatus]|uniref:Carboxylic ester hydrolase n=1 Tax=Pristionchus fissidentatus TaxID=1538716 RepID=A0AAV5VP44_9BILA|nr:hypothetical protein PFISCL1PPCAC_11052 [Pristionchus fissidentatus]
MGVFHSFPDSRIVSTHYGKIVGRRLLSRGEKHVDAFQGIPYARPPVGELRFKKPQPPECWDGVRNAKSFGNRSIQKDLLFIDHWRKGAQSEDCLLLNVFSPDWKPPGKGFPVMVYIHGGGFSMDSAGTYGDVSICETLCMKDVIVVTVQYRLGYLGFWTTGDSVCPGNLGLWDQTEALKWVQQNIGAFGGNKDNVTILGQSAGGASVDFLSLSPHSNHLFHRVIPMAGNASAKWALSPTMKLQCEKKAVRLGCDWRTSEELMSQLRDLPASAFGISMMAADTEKDAELECTPVLDGDFLPATVEELRKAAPVMSRMTGVAKMEGLLFLITIKSTESKLKKLMYKALPKTLPNRDSVHSDFLSKYIDLEQKPDSDTIYRAMNEIYSDLSMNAPTLKQVRDTIGAHPEAPVYNYVFSHLNAKAWGPFRWYLSFLEPSHCHELPYIFGQGIIFNFTFNENDRKMADMFSTAFTNFAKYGDPNGAPSTSDLPVRWEPATRENEERHYNFDLQPEMCDSYFKGRPAQLLHYKKLAEATMAKL